MKKNHVLFAAALLAAAPAAMAAPEISWIDTVHDFGAFDEDNGHVACEFLYVNIGDEPLLLTGARASCGCTTPRYSREPLAPGDTAAVTVTFDPIGRAGRFSKKIQIDSNTEPRRSTLEIKGVVIGSAATVGQRFPVDYGALKLRTGAVMVGEVAKGKMQTVFVDGYNRSTSTLKPRVVDLPPYMGATTAPESVAPGEQFSLVFYFHSSRCPLYGLVDAEVALDAGDGSEPRRLPVVAMVKEDFSKLSDAARAKAPVVRLGSDRLDFGSTAGAGSEMTRTMEIHNDGRSPLLIRRVYSADKGVSASISSEKIKPGKSAVLTVTVDPAALPDGDLLNARVQIIANDPATPASTVRIVGTR